jgi:hypothetical protein
MSSLLLKIILQNTRTLQLNLWILFTKVINELSEEAWV